MINKINISSGRQKQIVYIFLAVFTLAVFWQVTKFDFVNFDDIYYVSYNDHVKSGITLEGLRWALSTNYADFWQPLTWLSLMLDHQLYGLHAGGYHLTNLILHIMSTLLLFWLFNRMTGSIWRSAFVAALFALHPLHVETVAWISKRKDVLSTFWGMLTLCLYIHYSEKPVIKRYLLVLFSFVLALMSKPMVVTLPVVMILLDYWPLERLSLQKNKTDFVLWQLKEKIPFFILSAVFSVVTFYARVPGKSLYFSPLTSHLANAPVSFITYLEKIFWPHDMAVLYPFPDQIPFWQIFGSTLLIIIISMVIILMVKRLPYLFVGWLWYSITILPVIGIIQVSYRAMSDNYTYLPSVGIAIMIAWGFPLLFPNKEIFRKFLFLSGIAFLIIMSALTWRQCGYWENSIQLWNHTLQVTKNNYLAHSNISYALFDKGKYEEAIAHHNEVIRAYPNHILIYNNYNNRGIAYAKVGRCHQAIEDFNEVIRRRPNYAVYYNRGLAYDDLGQYKRAIADFNEAIRLKSDYADAYKNRGIIYFSQVNYEMGCLDAQKVCELGNCEMLEWAKGKGYCY